MPRLKWGDDAERTYETGVDRGVLYPSDSSGVAWNGLVSMLETSADSEEAPHYIDGVKYQIRRSPGTFAGTLEAFTYPDEFMVYDGLIDGAITHQPRKSFGMSYRTKIGNALTSDAGSKIHIVYNALAAPTERGYASSSDTEEAMLFSWEIATLPVPVKGAKASAHLVIDTTKTYSFIVSDLENFLYGTEERPPTLPSPEDIFSLFETNAILRVIDNGDGTFTVTGPDEAIQMLDPTTFQIISESAVFIDGVSYRISSL